MRGSGQKEQVVIIGASFAGVPVTGGLGTAGVHATLLGRQNYHQFQPLLYQVATAVLSPADMAELVRRMLRRFPDVEVELEEVTGLDAAMRQVRLGDGKILAYDILVLAAGTTRAYFGHDEWAQFAPSLKATADARKVRSRLLRSFEMAEASGYADERRRMMTSVAVGGGPSGVELAGTIAELARSTLAKDFHRIDAKSTTLLLLEAGPRILSAFPQASASHAQRKLTALGVTVRENCPVKNISRAGVVAGNDTIPAGLAIWATGVNASPSRQTAPRADRQDRTREGQSRSLRAGTADRLCARRHRTGSGCRRRASTRPRTGGQAEGPLSRPRACKNSRWRRGFAFHNRGNAAMIGRQSADRRLRLVATEGHACIALVGAGSYLSADRLSASPAGRCPMALAIRDLRSRGAADRGAYVASG